MVLTPLALWVVPVSNLAGVARHALDVAREGIPGWRLAFLAPPGDLPRELRALGADVIEGSFGPDHGLRASSAVLRDVVSRLRPEVVHSHLSYADIVVGLAAGLVRGQRPRLVTTEHGIARDDVVYHHSSLKARVMATAHTARLWRLDAAIAVSRATAEAMQDKWHPRREIVVIPNGVDPVERASRAPGLRILSLARLAPEKRTTALIEGFARLVHEHPEATLTLAGTGEQEHVLRRQVDRLGLTRSVSLPGFVDPVSAMAEHDVLAMLSIWENCSYALLDAAIAGMGVVASNVGGNPEIVAPTSLVDATDATAVARALAVQGLDVASRPGLDGWPSVAHMCARISDVYAETHACR